MPGLPTIMLCPAGTVQAASSRLRCFGLARELQRLGCVTHLGLDAAVLPDLLYVQKRVTPEILAHARRVHAGGGKVVFDIDDWGHALDWIKADPALLAQFLPFCAAVSVDTDVRAEVFAQDAAYQAVPSFWVVPDPIDYIESAVEPPSHRAFTTAEGDRLLQGCWFGNVPNAMPAVPYMQAALHTGRVGRFSVITNGDAVPHLQQLWPMLDVQPWQLDTFAATLRTHDFCLLIHDSGTEGIQKSNNKMLAALGQGVVPLVSNTPAYAQTARHIGLPELLLDTPADLARCLQPQQMAGLREGILGDTCRRALREYTPQTVARGFLDKVVQLLQAPPAATPLQTQTQGQDQVQAQAQTPAQAHTGTQTQAPAAVPIKLNLGCGDVPLQGYVNVDVASQRGGHQPDICCDIRDLRAFADGHADEVMAIHVIEHFYRWEVVGLLKEWVRVLKPGGKLVLECPNLLTACEALLKSPDSAAMADQRGQRTMWCLYGDPQHQDPLMCHRWLYTPQSLAQVMHEAGLRNLAQTPPQFKLRHPRDMRVEGIKPLAAA